ncbi:hypothetical protein HOY82DRAFT_503362 [Tuber indicum]|nr:hypothetical protein HOY82DRAFT_503362 [Tuber indicum]
MSENTAINSESLNFSIALFPTGSTGSAFRTQNTPGEFQRQNLVDRSSDFMVQGDLVNVIHGRFSPGGDEATLVVTEFRFLSSQNGRHFRRATIEFLFARTPDNMSDGSYDPEVVRISLMGKNSLNPTYETQELKRIMGTTAEVNGGSFLKLGGNIGWEVTKSFQREYRATVTGAIALEGRNFGAKNQAKWIMLENESAANGDGIPTLLRTAILLKRKYGGTFVATIKVNTKVDTLNSMFDKFEKLFGRIPKDDPVFFDPDLPPMGNVPTDLDIENLSSYDLEKLSTVLSMNLIPTVATGTVTASASGGEEV